MHACRSAIFIIGPSNTTTRWYAGLGRRFLLGYKHGAVGTLCEVDCSDAINLVHGRVKNPGRTTKDTAGVASIYQSGD
ncbi:hypothetical protein HBI32_168060 [Parastagonospora nodorum]|nr:hypothetical protein HBI32_168060 [Parastagonospora nodorum]